MHAKRRGFQLVRRPRGHEPSPVLHVQSSGLWCAEFASAAGAHVRLAEHDHSGSLETAATMHVLGAVLPMPHVSDRLTTRRRKVLQIMNPRPTTYKAKVHDPARREGVCNVKSIRVFPSLFDATMYARATVEADHLLSVEIIQEECDDRNSVTSKCTLGHWRWNVDAVRSFPL
jgi:hypothetical protein